MTQDELEEALSLEFDTVGEVFDWGGGDSSEDFNNERDEFIQWGIGLMNKCIKGRLND